MTLTQVLLACVTLLLMVAFYATKNAWFLAGLGFCLLVLIMLFYLSLPGQRRPGEQVRY